jgi:hypothetical protein
MSHTLWPLVLLRAMTECAQSASPALAASDRLPAMGVRAFLRDLSSLVRGFPQ